MRGAGDGDAGGDDSGAGAADQRGSTSTGAASVALGDAGMTAAAGDRLLARANGAARGTPHDMRAGKIRIA